MKHIYKIISTVICTIFLFASCNLDRYPTTSFTDEQLEQDPEMAFQYLINGCYSQLKAWSNEMHRIGEYPGDNMAIRGQSSDSFFKFISYGHTPQNDRLEIFWQNSYKAIVQANDVLALKEEGESDAIDYNLGEAYYIRGFLYFYLTRTFGRPYYQDPEKNLGVPITLAGSSKTLAEIYAPDRATVKECYARAIEDLEKAEKLMTKASATVSKKSVYASPEAAQAMLSRIYLFMSGTYENPNIEYAQKSIDYAQKVLNSGRFKLLERGNFIKYNEFAPDNATQTETIFAIKRVEEEFPTNTGYTYSIGGMYSQIAGVGWGEMFASAKYMELLNKAGYQKQDGRWGFIEEQYKIDDKTKEKIPAFRFVADIKNKNGTLTGCEYVQGNYEEKDGKSLMVIMTKDSEGKDVRKEWELTPYQLEDNLYKITYDGKTYIGTKDYFMLTNNNLPMFYIYKCSKQGGKSQLHSPIISRLAEMHLNMAEAYAKLGKYEDARTQVNIIRGRAIVGGEYETSEFTPDNAKQLINEERQLELAYEAERGFDIYRNGETLTRFYPGAHDALLEVKATSNRVVHYIPKAEIDAYPGLLTQNPI